MSDDATAGEMAALRASLDALRVAIEAKMDASLRPIEKAMRLISLTPAAVAAVAAFAWLFYQGKISQEWWGIMTMIPLSPFFGEVIEKVLDRFPLPKRAVDAVKVVLFCAVAGGVLALSGCGAAREAAQRAGREFRENYQTSAAISYERDGAKAEWRITRAVKDK